jgi:hypothetical protein
MNESSVVQRSHLASRLWERGRALFLFLLVTGCTISLFQYITASAFYAARGSVQAQLHTWGHFYLAFAAVLGLSSWVVAYRAEWYAEDTAVPLRVLFSLVIVGAVMLLEVIFVALLQGVLVRK